ncbi:SH3 domain-containing protein [bacterium]|nr:SH3 domain-containing protein [bacterium]
MFRILKIRIPNLFRISDFGFRILFGIWILTFILISGCASKLCIAPYPLPHVKVKMHTPGYWISKIDNPDKVIMSTEEIEKFNETNRKRERILEKVIQIDNIMSGKQLSGNILNSSKRIQREKWYTTDNVRVDNLFFEAIYRNIDPNKIPDKVDIKFGLTLRRTNLRVLPTDEIIMSRKNNHDFDRFKDSAIDVGQPLALLWETRDKKWAYVKTEITSGWIHAEDIAISDNKNDIIEYRKAQEFVVVTGNKIDIFSDSECKNFLDSAQMGTHFPLMSSSKKEYFTITFPAANKRNKLSFRKAYIPAYEDVHTGYVPYTKRNAINQAFKLLHAPYGWGGMKGERDCSRFIMDIFACFGIRMPRNSSWQAKMGREIAGFDRFKNLPPGISILYMPGHIMLYLGEDNGNYYVIHDTWEYTEGRWPSVAKKYIGRVVVSDLSLGEYGKTGSLLERLKSASVID